jgi:hypothetical protein
MLGIGTVEFQLGFQWHTIGQSSLKTLCDGITGWVDEVIYKFKDKVIPGVSDREVFLKDFEQALIFPVFRSRLQLKKIL